MKEKSPVKSILTEIKAKVNTFQHPKSKKELLSNKYVILFNFRLIKLYKNLHLAFIYNLS